MPAMVAPPPEKSMLRAGVGLSTERDSGRAAAEAAAMALRACSSQRADLVLVFATTAHGPGFTSVTRTVGEVCGTRQIVGCSAAGVLSGEAEVENAPGVAVLALQGQLTARRFFVPFSPREGERVADDVADAVGEPAPGVLVLFADCYNLDPEPLLRGLARRLPGVPVVGGGASEDGSVGQVSVFAGDAVSSSAVSGVFLGGEVRATAGVAHGVRRVGAVHRVTAARG